MLTALVSPSSLQREAQAANLKLLAYEQEMQNDHAEATETISQRSKRDSINGNEGASNGSTFFEIRSTFSEKHRSNAMAETK